MILDYSFSVSSIFKLSVFSGFFCDFCVIAIPQRNTKNQHKGSQKEIQYHLKKINTFFVGKRSKTTINHSQSHRFF